MTLALTTKVAALVAFTETGATARRVAAYRPALLLLVFTPHREVQNQLSLVWGVESFASPKVATTDELIEAADQSIRDLNRAQPDDTVVIVAGTPPGKPGSTNNIRVHSIS